MSSHFHTPAPLRRTSHVLQLRPVHVRRRLVARARWHALDDHLNGTCCRIDDAIKSRQRLLIANIIANFDILVLPGSVPQRWPARKHSNSCTCLQGPLTLPAGRRPISLGPRVNCALDLHLEHGHVLQMDDWEGAFALRPRVAGVSPAGGPQAPHLLSPAGRSMSATEEGLQPWPSHHWKRSWHTYFDQELSGDSLPQLQNRGGGTHTLRNVQPRAASASVMVTARTEASRYLAGIQVSFGPSHAERSSSRLCAALSSESRACIATARSSL